MRGTGRRPSIWSLRCRKGSCGLPGDSSRALRSAERRRPPIWPCSGWGLPASRLAPGPGALLPHRFTLACPSRCREAIGAIVSVALSVASLRLGVTQHPALWSPDFPPRRRRSGRPALLTCPVYALRGRARRGALPYAPLPRAALHRDLKRSCPAQPAYLPKRARATSPSCLSLKRGPVGK